MAASALTGSPVTISRSKLEPPRVSGPYMIREALEARLDQMLAVPLAIITAPPGHGKTRTLIEWLERRQIASAWLNLGPQEGDVTRFAAHLAAALDRVSPGISAELHAHLIAPDRLESRLLGEAFGDSLFDLHDDLVLVLDDFHTAGTAAVCEFVSGLVLAAPARLHTILNSRQAPALSLARLRMMGQVIELRAADLRFAEHETAALLRDVVHSDLSPELAARVHAAAGGWPAAVRLMAIGIEAGANGDRANLTRNLADSQLLFDYISDEVLSQISPLQRDLLLRAALPARFNAELLRALGRDDAEGELQRADLESLRSLDLYREIPGLDTTWFAYHPLFRETFQRQLASDLGPDRLADLHRVCAQWFAGEGHTREAVRHWVEAGDIAAASAHIEGAVVAAFAQEDWTTIEDCLTMVPEEEIAARPELLLASAWVSYLGGRGGKLASRFGHLRSMRNRGLLNESQSAEFDLLQIGAVIFNNVEPEQTLMLAERTVGRIPRSRRYRHGFAQMHLGMALGAVGRVDEAIEHLTTFTVQESAQIDAATTRGFFGRILVLWQAGRVAACEQVAADLFDLAHRNHLDVSDGWGRLFFGMAAHEQGSIDAAEEQFASVVADAERLHFYCVREAFSRQILIYQLSGRVEEADRALARLRELIIAIEAPEHLSRCDSLAARLAMFRGDTSATQRWLASSAADMSTMQFMHFENPVATRAMALINERSPENLVAADALLQELLRRALRAHAQLTVMDTYALIAALREAEGDQRGAGEAMRQALIRSADQQLARRYTFLAVPLVPIVRRIARERDASPHARDVLAALEAVAAPEDLSQTAIRQTANECLVEPLTSREREVLGCLERRLTNDEIGQELFISPITARNHVRHICRKLGVSGRRTAIVRAREFGLLS
ncbi:MAG: LuxR C-terminal-related transcriptional regulator [Thermomicrobiales bacterium]